MKESMILIVFVIIGLILAINLFRSFKTSGEFFGRPPINQFLFFSGKTANILIWVLLIAHVLGASISLIMVPVYIETAGLIIFIAGSLIVIVSFLTMGMAIRFGLSDSNKLLTSGIYRLSRNPMYLGFFLIDTAALFIMFNPSLLILLILVIYTHHKTVKAEEEFLKEKFGQLWTDYTSRTGRYI